MFRIFKTDTFETDYNRLDRSEQIRIDTLIEGLFDHGDSVGKPLGVPFFREKKFGGKRILYLVYTSLSSILLVAVVNKKTQESTIQEILANLREYQKIIFEKIA